MLNVEFNSLKKAEKCIVAGVKTHSMHWEKFYMLDSEGGLIVRYVVFYSQRNKKKQGN